jgi:hypothetical protein
MDGTEESHAPTLIDLYGVPPGVGKRSSRPLRCGMGVSSVEPPRVKGRRRDASRRAAEAGSCPQKVTQSR